MRSSLLALGLLVLAAFPAHAATPHATTSFDWTTTGRLGDTAARVTVTLLEPSLCSWHFHAAGSQGAIGGPFMFTSLANESAGRFSGSRVSASRSQHAHVEDVADVRAPVRVADTTTLFPTGTWAGQGWTNATAPMGAATYTFTVGGLGLAPTRAEPGRLGSFSLRLAVTCDREFVVDGFAGSHELMLWNAGSMRGGAGAYVSLVADATVDNAVERAFSTPLVQNELWFKRYNEVGHAGELTRTTPSGVTTWDLLAVPEVQLYDATGPGLHRYELDRVALDFFSTLSGASYGLAPMASFDEL